MNVFALPNKATCTPAEAAQSTGLSERQVRYLIEDGSLLAMSANRDTELTSRPQWRVIVRIDRPLPAGRTGRTLDELVKARLNQ